MFHAIPIAGSLPWCLSESSWVIGSRMRIFCDPIHTLITIVTEVWKFGDFTSGWKVFDKQVTFCTVRDTQDTLANYTRVRVLWFTDSVTRGEARLNYVTRELHGLLYGEVDPTLFLFRGEASFQLTGRNEPSG